jgi:hypothetical protein
MMPPLSIEIPTNSLSGKESTLSDVLGVEKVAGEYLDHTVTIKVSCLSGITTNRPLCRDNSSQHFAASPPNKMKAMVAVFQNSQAKGSSGFSLPLSLSSSRMFADDSTSRYVAMWNGLDSSAGSSLSFDVPLLVSNGVIEPEKFELLVFLADHREDRNVTVAYPIGLGSFVVGDEEIASAKSVDLRVKYISSRSGFPAMEISKNTQRDKAGETPAIRFTPLSRVSRAIAATYSLDVRGGGFIRMNIGWRHKAPLSNVALDSRPCESPMSCDSHHPSLDESPRVNEPARLPYDEAARSCEEKRPGHMGSTHEPSPEDISLQRSSHLRRRVASRGAMSRTPSPELDFYNSQGNDIQSTAAAKIAANLKFPSRTSRRQLSPQDKLFNAQVAKGLPPQYWEAKHPFDEQQALETQAEPKINIDMSLVKLESPSFSYDESMVREMRTWKKAGPQLLTSPSGVLSMEETATFAPSTGIFHKVLQLMDSLVTCGNYGTARVETGPSSNNNKLPFMDTWNTYDEEDGAWSMLEKNQADEDNMSALAHLAEGRWTPLVNLTEGRWAPCGNEVMSCVAYAKQVTEQVTVPALESPKWMMRCQSEEDTTGGDASPTMWNDLASAQRDMCVTDAASVTSSESEADRRRSKGKKKKGYWV